MNMGFGGSGRDEDLAFNAEGRSIEVRLFRGTGERQCVLSNLRECHLGAPLTRRLPQRSVAEWPASGSRASPPLSSGTLSTRISMLRPYQMALARAACMRLLGDLREGSKGKRLKVPIILNHMKVLHSEERLHLGQQLAISPEREEPRRHVPVGG
jgi:hypothetical protein